MAQLLGMMKMRRKRPEFAYAVSARIINQGVQRLLMAPTGFRLLLPMLIALIRCGSPSWNIEQPDAEIRSN
jgi:hypothetical protein